MKITSIKTDKITKDSGSIFDVLEKFLKSVNEDSVVAVSSKVVAICEGRVTKVEDADKQSLRSINLKDELIAKESQLYLPRETNPYEVSLTISHNTLVATAGIDESNGNGFYILWPNDPQKSANEIREYIKKRFNLKNVGVIITDSRTTPLRWGVTAIAISYSGFVPLKNYIGKPDVFGRDLIHTKMSIIDNLASAAALTMGEGNEQRPVAIIEEIPDIEFQDRNPTQEELNDLKIKPSEDLYAPLLNSVDWKKGEQP